MRKITPAESETFARAARKANLHIPGVSAATAAVLTRMQTTPLPIAKRTGGHHNAPSPSPKCSIGPLITNKLARLEGKHYITTPEGNNYLEKIKKAGIQVPEL